MRIRWYGHSCFQVAEAGYSIVLDPYCPGMIPGLGRLDLSADEVLCSHEHEDHNFRQGVRLTKSKTINPFEVTRISGFHDDVYGARRGKNWISVLKAGGIRAVHFGDLGCSLSADQISSLKGAEILMIPVGGFFTINARQAKEICEALVPRVIIPMHFRGRNFGFSQLDPLERFLSLFDSEQIVIHPGAEMEITRETSRQIAVLRLPDLSK